MLLRTLSETTIHERLAYGFVFVIVAVGMIISRWDEQVFRDHYVPEDGFLENFTAVMLFAAGAVAVWRLIMRGRGKSRSFFVTTSVIALLAFFGAGEEISWGQRIFDWQSGEFFTTHNAQGETNLHNLTVGDLKINRLLFGSLLTLGVLFYFLLLPVLFTRVPRIQRFLDGLHIPVPKTHHGIALLIAALAILLVPSDKGPELNEVCLSVFLFLTILGPLNAKIYQPTAPAAVL